MRQALGPEGSGLEARAQRCGAASAPILSNVWAAVPRTTPSRSRSNSASAGIAVFASGLIARKASAAALRTAGFPSRSRSVSAGMAALPSCPSDRKVTAASSRTSAAPIPKYRHNARCCVGPHPLQRVGGRTADVSIAVAKQSRKGRQGGLRFRLHRLQGRSGGITNGRAGVSKRLDQSRHGCIQADG